MKDQENNSSALDKFLSSHPIFSILGMPVISIHIFGILFAAGGIPLLLGVVAALFAVVIFFGIASAIFNNKSKSISRPPASFLLSIIHLFPKKYRSSLEQEISDMRLEYFEALNEKNIACARAIVISYYIGLGWSALKWIAERIKELIILKTKVN